MADFLLLKSRPNPTFFSKACSESARFCTLSSHRTATMRSTTSSAAAVAEYDDNVIGNGTATSLQQGSSSSSGGRSKRQTAASSLSALDYEVYGSTGGGGDDLDTEDLKPSRSKRARTGYSTAVPRSSPSTQFTAAKGPGASSSTAVTDPVHQPQDEHFNGDYPVMTLSLNEKEARKQARMIRNRSECVDSPTFQDRLESMSGVGRQFGCCTDICSTCRRCTSIEGSKKGTYTIPRSSCGSARSSDQRQRSLTQLDPTPDSDQLVLDFGQHGSIVCSVRS